MNRARPCDPRLNRRLKARPTIEALETRLALAGIVNGDFSLSDPTGPEFGYTLRGDAVVSGGQGVLNEGGVVQSGILQTFTILPGATEILMATGSTTELPSPTRPASTGSTRCRSSPGPIPFLAGPNTLRAQATNAAGSTTATRVVTLDARPPTGILVAPASGSTASQDLGFLEIQWTDTGAAGLDETSFGLGDVMITGVDIDAIENLGGGRVRYRYNLDGDTLPSGTISVTLVAGQVADLAGNMNRQSVQTFLVASTTPQPPVARPNAYTVAEDGVLMVGAPGVLVDDTDPEGAPLTAVLVSGAAHGEVRLNPDGSFTYTPAANFHGADNFAYQPSDGLLLGNVATVYLTVTPVNDPPVVVDDRYSATGGSPLSVPAPGVLSNDTDIDGDRLTAILVSGPGHGTLVLQPDGSFLYTPNRGFSGMDSFSYVASDGTANGRVATVFLTVPACGVPFRLLPDTPYFQFLRARRAIKPSRFDLYHPRVGALIGLEVDGIPSTPTRLLPGTSRFNSLRARRGLDPARFDRHHPVVGALIRLETLEGDALPAPFLPRSRSSGMIRARRELNPARFDRNHPYLGVLITLESVLACTPIAGTTRAVDGR